MNTKLKLACMDCGLTQYQVAHMLGISETRMSRIVQGRIVPTEHEESELARVLGRARRALFTPEGTKTRRAARRSDDSGGQ